MLEELKAIGLWKNWSIHRINAGAFAIVAMMKVFSAKYIPTNILIAEFQQAGETNTSIDYLNKIFA